jgi:hypothetical protein
MAMKRARIVTRLATITENQRCKVVVDDDAL